MGAPGSYFYELPSINCQQGTANGVVCPSVHSNLCFAGPLLKEISLNACNGVHSLCAIKQVIGECKVPIFMNYHPSIVSKVLQMGLSVHLFIQTHVI